MIAIWLRLAAICFRLAAIWPYLAAIWLPLGIIWLRLATIWRPRSIPVLVPSVSGPAKELAGRAAGAGNHWNATEIGLISLIHHLKSAELL